MVEAIETTGIEIDLEDNAFLHDVFNRGVAAGERLDLHLHQALDGEAPLTTHLLVSLISDEA